MWILFILIWFGPGDWYPSIHTQEFDSQERCEDAQQAVEFHRGMTGPFDARKPPIHTWCQAK